MQKNKTAWLKWIVISCGIGLSIATAIILVVPAFVSGNFAREEIIRILDDSLKSNNEVGLVSFHWPNRIEISYLVIRNQGQEAKTPLRLEEIQGALKLFPLLSKKFVVKKISIRRINYENRLLVKDLVTDTFSFKGGIVSTQARLSVNEGPAVIKGTLDLRQKKPAFDFSLEAKDVHITQDIPAINTLPVFTVRDGEVGGMLNLKGCLRGKGRRILNKNLDASFKIEVRDGYIRGSKLLSSILEIIGAKDLYSFDLIEASVRIKEGRIYTPQMDVNGALFSLNASGTATLEGSIAYDATVRFNKERLNKDIEKIASLVLKENALQLEVRGTTGDPKVSVKLTRNNLDHILKGLVNDFLSSPKERQKKEDKK